MENKLQMSRVLWYPVLFMFVLLLSSVQLRAQDIDDYYNAFVQDEGSLYFIEPVLEFKGAEKPCKIVLDITYPSSSDSLTVNFTYYESMLMKLDSIALYNPITKVQSSVSPIYFEPMKKKWKHRYTSHFEFQEFESLFRSNNQLSLRIYANGKMMPLSIKPKKWKKLQPILARIFDLIKANGEI